MRKRLWDLAKSRIEIGTILPGHRHKVQAQKRHGPHGACSKGRVSCEKKSTPRHTEGPLFF